jgi:hypothetical protein
MNAQQSSDSPRLFCVLAGFVRKNPALVALWLSPRRPETVAQRLRINRTGGRMWWPDFLLWKRIVLKHGLAPIRNFGAHQVMRRRGLRRLIEFHRFPYFL